MVEFANQLQERGDDLKNAIIKAAGTRLRPILMTTFAMILGATPLAFPQWNFFRDLAVICREGVVEKMRVLDH